MTDEENKLIKQMIKRNKEHCVDDVDYSVPFLINLIEKQSKEIEELKEVKWYYEISRVPKDKIKAKIEYYEKIDNPVGKRVLQSLLEKED